MLRNNSDMPKALKNKMVSGNPRPYSTSNVTTQVVLMKKLMLHAYRNKQVQTW